MSLLAVGLFLKRVGLSAWTWLSHRSFWQLAFGAALIWGALEHFGKIDARHDAAKWQKQFQSEHAKLEAISTKRNEQKQTTAERIKVVTRTIHDADGKAKVIEQAPLPGNCKTPSEVLQADL